MIKELSQAKDILLPKGKHVVVLPLSVSLPIESIFPREITGSYIENFDTQLGTFVNKEKITFLHNRFSMSEHYQQLNPFQVVRLTLKREIKLSWRVTIDFQSHSRLSIKPALDLDTKYSPEKALYLSKICSLIYHDELTIKQILKESYDFTHVNCFSKSTTHRLVRRVTQSNLLNMAYAFFRVRRTIIDLQFTKLIKKDKEPGKYTIVLAFRGSNESEDWLTNLQASHVPFICNKGLLVHRGFQAALKTFLRHIQRHPFQLGEGHFQFNKKELPLLNEHCQIILTGHSLGGSVATLLGCYLYENGLNRENLEVYTFGAPPVGSLKFTEYYQDKFSVYRITNSLDPIPMLSYVTHLNHLGQLINLPSNEGEMHTCEGYIDNLLDSLELAV